MAEEAGTDVLERLAQKHGVSVGAVRALAAAIASGGGRMAQFNHLELGGMGQWSGGGMIMIGDMFNHGLKARVQALCEDLISAGTAHATEAGSSQGRGQEAKDGRWPADLGIPSATGSQNGVHYAVFPAARRLAIEEGGKVTIYDTADHTIHGVSQAQSHGRSLTFSGQHGPIQLSDLKAV